MKVMVSEVDNIIIVDVTVELRGDFGKKEVVDTKIVKDYLKSKQIEFDECIQSTIVTNEIPKKILGTWKFTKKNLNRKELLDELTQLSQKYGEYDQGDENPLIKEKKFDNVTRTPKRKRKVSNNE